MLVLSVYVLSAALANLAEWACVVGFVECPDSRALQEPKKHFIPAPPINNCACNECPFMRLNTLEKLYLAMKNRTPELTLPEHLRIAALRPMQRMLEMS